MMRQTPQPTDPGSSEPVSETESGCESADPLAPETVRMLRLELEGERRQNKQLQAKLKRAAKLNEQLVRTAAWPRAAAAAPPPPRRPRVSAAAL